MNRRHFLQGLGAGAAGLCFTAIASPTGSTPISATAERRRVSGAQRGAKFCKIIGIGGAGCNCVLAMGSGAVPESAEYVPEFICLDLDRTSLGDVAAASSAVPGGSPIKCVSLARFGAGGNVNFARAAALREREAISGMLADADVVFLVAGLGRGTGSGVTPIMARLAREAGARTVAVCITPFEFEGQQRHRKADTALRYLNGEADLLVALSNEEWAKAHSEDTPMIDVFNGLDRQIADCIRGLMDKAGKPSIGAEQGISVGNGRCRTTVQPA